MIKEGIYNMEFKAEEIVQKQLEFYNANNLEGLNSLYSESIKIYNFLDNTIIMEGKEALRINYRERFEILKECYIKK